jgi:putative ABC transport system permease protein
MAPRASIGVGSPLMDTLRRDLALALRGLRQAPAFAGSVVTMLALAIGATTAVYSVVHGALVRPLPHVDVDRWANLFERPVNEGLESTISVSIPNYRDWRDASRTFAALVLWMPWSYNLSGDDQAPERLAATIVTPNLFRALALKPSAGRLLEDRDEPLQGRVVMISEGLWTRRFARDPAIVGRPIRLNGVPHTVVGVTPRDFTFPVDARVDVFVPQSMQAIASSPYRDARGLQVSGLLRPGVTWEAARAEMDGIAARLAATWPEDRGFGVSVVPMRESLAGDVRRPLLTLLAALGLIVVLVSVNVANLKLVRLEGRRHEFAVRTALGASRARLLRQALTESVLLATLAAALGALLAPAFVRGLLAFVPEGELPWLHVPADRTMLLGAVAVATAVAVIAGVVPALRGIRADLSAALARGGRGTAAPIGRRVRQAAVVVQLALSLVLVVSAALLIQTFVRLQGVDPGFRASGRMTLSVYAPRARYPDTARLVAFAERLREEIGRTPGVDAIATAQALPFVPGVVWLQALTRADPRSIGNLGELPHVHCNVVSPGYAAALGVPLKAGRGFDATDSASSLPVVMINEALARRFFPNEDPIGQTISVGHAQALPQLPRRTIVGVVGDARWSGLADPAGPEAWVPYSQQAGTDDLLRTLHVVFAAGAQPEARMADVRKAIARADPELPVTAVRTLESRLAESLWRQRLAAAALGALGFAALGVALVGILAVTSYLVGRRTQEMGVRLALGARPQAIVRLVLAESGRLVIAGAALGLAGAAAMARLLSSLLYGVSAIDVPTFAAAGLGLSAAAILACYVPARRASRVDPVVTLRNT